MRTLLQAALKLVLPIGLIGLSACANPQTKPIATDANNVVAVTPTTVTTMTTVLATATLPPRMTPELTPSVPPISQQAGKLRLPTPEQVQAWMPAWQVEQRKPHVITLLPRDNLNWRAQTPADFAKSPLIEISWGDAIRERFATSDFPTNLSESNLRDWLIKTRKLSVTEKIRSRQIAFFVTERAVPGCDQTAYVWRGDVVRMATGCNSDYANDFLFLVESLMSY